MDTKLYKSGDIVLVDEVHYCNVVYSVSANYTVIKSTFTSDDIPLRSYSEINHIDILYKIHEACSNKFISVKHIESVYPVDEKKFFYKVTVVKKVIL
jgi:hypothetical protein